MSPPFTNDRNERLGKENWDLRINRQVVCILKLMPLRMQNDENVHLQEQRDAF